MHSNYQREHSPVCVWSFGRDRTTTRDRSRLSNTAFRPPSSRRGSDMSAIEHREIRIGKQGLSQLAVRIGPVAERDHYPGGRSRCHGGSFLPLWRSDHSQRSAFLRAGFRSARRMYFAYFRKTILIYMLYLVTAYFQPTPSIPEKCLAYSCILHL